MNSLLVLLLVSTLVTSPLPLPTPQTSAFRGSPITLSVQLKSQNGTPIENATVLFYHESHNELIGSAITNSTGFARFIWMIPFDHELGPVQLNCTFRGDPERYLLPSMVPIPLTIFAQLQNNFNVTDENGYPVSSEVRIGQRLFFHTLITDDNSEPLGAVAVQFVLEPNKILAEKITPQNGSLVFSYTLNHTIESPIILKIKSLNQGYYNGTESTFQFLIRNSTSLFLGLPKFCHPSNGYSLEGKLSTLEGYGIPNASIELLLESGEVLKTTQTVNDGHFNLDLYDVSDSIRRNRHMTLRYNGTLGQSETRAIIGIIASPPHNPFTQSIDPISSSIWLRVLHQISILTVSCLTIGASLLTLRMKRSTKRIVSH